MKGLVWIIIVFLGIYCVLAFIPAWHELIYNATQSLETPLRILIRFVFDPTEYVWKWIVGLLIMIIVFFSSREG